MAGSLVVKNVFSFAKILCQAGTDVVHHWDLKSLGNAFNWARYSEKVEEQTRGKTFRGQLDQQLQSLTVLLTPVMLLDLSLDSLSHALVHLGQVLIENPSLPDELRKAVQTELAVTGKNANIPIKKLPNSFMEDNSSTGRTIKCLLGYDPSIPETSEGQANVIVQRLVRIKKASTNKQRYFSFFEELLAEVVKVPLGWETLLYMLLIGVESEDVHWQIEEIKGEILHWIMQETNLNSSLWKVDTELLCEVCARDDQFFRFYKKSVLQWATEMEPVYGLTTEGDLYKWSYKAKKSEVCICDNSSVRQCFCYDSLVRHVCGLLRHDVNNRWNFETVITDLSKQSHFNIWTEVLKSVKARLQ